jgi:peroxiredoxin
MVNLTDGKRETVEIASDFIRGSGFSFPVYFDTEQNAAYTYGVYSIPTTYFIDKEGNIIQYKNSYGETVTAHLGVMDKETLQSGIDMIREAE